MMKNKFFNTLIASFLSLCFTSSVIAQTNNSSMDKPQIDIVEKGIIELQAGYQNNLYSVTQTVEAYINRIEAVDKNGPTLNSIIVVNPDALAIAKALDEKKAAGEALGKLFGIPVILKDNIDTKDKMPCTAGSKALANSFPKKDSWLVAQLREEDAIILGKSNLSEWANFRSILAVPVQALEWLLPQVYVL